MGILETIMVALIIIAILGGSLGGPEAYVPGFGLAIFLMILLAILMMVEAAVALVAG